MTGTFQLKRGSTLQHIIGLGTTFGYTGPEGEVTVDTDLWTVRVHDGSTTGGYPLARGDMTNAHFNRKTITASYTITGDDYYIWMNAPGITVTLPLTADTEDGDIYIIKNISAVNTAGVNGNGANIDGQPTQTLAAYESMKLQTDATLWSII